MLHIHRSCSSTNAITLLVYSLEFLVCTGMHPLEFHSISRPHLQVIGTGNHILRYDTETPVSLAMPSMLVDITMDVSLATWDPVP